MSRYDSKAWCDAWIAAESLARQNRHTHAVIYRRKGEVRMSYEVLLDSKRPADGCEIVTTVSRKCLASGIDESSCETLPEALAFVLLNLPLETALADLVRVSHQANGEVWAYYFLSTTQEEIACWCEGEIDFFPGVYGKGRPIETGSCDKILRVTAQLAEARSLLEG